MIYHITTPTDWENAQAKGFYIPPAFAAEGFIHACKAEQVAGVRDRYYKDQTGLLVLHIDEEHLEAPHEFVFVPASNDEFPHILGMLNLDAVVEVAQLED